VGAPTDTAPATIDEFYERYRPYRPRDLQRMLNAADIDGIGKAAGAWYNTSNVLYTIADDLTAGLLQLRQNWTGVAADAFQKLMFALVARIRSMADEATAMQTGLSMMSASVGVAKDLLSGGVVLPSALGVLGGLVDAQLGYVSGQPTDTARVIADLALDYAMIERKVWYGPLPTRTPDPPPAVPAADPSALAGAPSTAATPGVVAAPPPPVSSPLGGAVPGVITVEAGRLPATAAAGASTATTPGAGMMPMGMMAGAHGGASGEPSRSSGSRWREDDIAWSRNEQATWVGPDELPSPSAGDRRPV
jgi:hypothetical protein